MSPERTIRGTFYILQALAFTVIGGAASAQTTPTYVSRQFPQPFAALSGATQVYTSMAWDGATLVPIGFTFDYYGVSYDYVEIAENGVMTLKPSCSLGCEQFEGCDFFTNICYRGYVQQPFDPLPSPNSPNNVLAAWWDDLTLDSASANASVVQYRLIGAAPNRTFIAEWRNIRRYNQFTGLPSQSRANFQIQLQETTNNVRFAYGPYTQNAADNASWQGRVGVEDRTGTTSVIPLTCAQVGFCDYQRLTMLNNQVIEIGVPNIPELTGVVEPTLGGLPGTMVTVHVQVQNVGRQPANASFDTSVYLSTDDIISPTSDFLLGSGTLTFVPENGSRTATITGMLPGNFAPGYYNLGAIIDTANTVIEATEANNTILSSELFLAGADLSVQYIAPPLPLPSGGSDIVSFQVTNRSSAVNNMAYRVHLSFDTVLDAQDTLIASGTQTFAASSITEINATANVPSSVVPSYYFIITTIDPLNVLSEADETNNVALDFVTVGPDVYPAYIDAPATSGRGASLTLTLGTANNGATVPNMDYEIWFSTDFNLDSGDTLIANGTINADRGVVTETEINITVPTNIMPGMYQIIGVSDPLNLVAELDDINNISTLNTINLIGPDLSAESLIGDRLAFLGQPYHATAVVSNVGGEPVLGFYTSFHLSANQLCTASDPLLTEVGPLDLNEGNRLTLTPDIVIPPNTALGQYYLCVIVDSRSLVVEDREQNNIRRAGEQITVRDIAPDFIVTDLLIPTIAGAGETFAVQRTLENQGNNLGGLPYSIFLTTQTGAQRIALIGTGNLALGVGEIHNGVDNVTVPADVVSGIYKIEYVLDPDTLVDEIFEDNNDTLSDETIEVENAQLLITTMTLAVATTGVEYQADLFAAGGSGPLVWSIGSGTLPEGLTLSASGRISGTPTTEGVSNFVAHVTDGSLSHERMLRITVAAPTIDLRVVTRAIPPVWVGQHYEYPMTALGGVPPYNWSVRPALPSGLTLTSSGTLAGDSSTTAASAVYTFTVEDAVGDTASAPLAVRVLARDDALRFATLSLPDGVVGTDYSEQLGSENGVPEYVFSLADGELPPGLSIVKTDSGSEVSGVPTVPGIYTFRLRVTDSRGDFDLNYFVVEIAASDSVSFVTKGLPPGKVGTAYKDRDDRPVSLKAIVLTGSGAIEYTVIQGALPAGVTLAMDGGISGTPTEKGVFSFTARAYDTTGKTEDLRAFGIVVEEQDTTPPTTIDDNGCGCNTAGETGGGAGSLAALFALGLAVLVSRRRSLLAGLGLVTLLVVSGTDAFAQRGDAGIADSGADAGTAAAPYFVSQYSETYVTRTGGTQLSFTSPDDGESIYQLPFSFKLYNGFYSEVHVGTNGYVSFVSNAASLSNQNFPDFFDPNAVISLFWDDLYTGVVTVNVEGTEPNRIVIIQWDDMEHYPSGSGEDFEFQLWLYEGNAARFELHYGATANLNQAMFFAAIGFEDETGTTGQNLLTCSPGCSGTDLEGLQDQVIRALQDAGEDIFALAVNADVTGDPLRLYQGINFDVHTTMAAYHDTPVGPFIYSIYLLGQNELTPTTPAIFTSAETTLGEYETRTTIDSLSIPLSVSPGRYRLAFEVDTDGQVMEPNETNNFSIGSQQQFIVGERAPDLSVTGITPPMGAIAPGDTVTLRADIGNIGNLDTSASWRMVISPNRAPSVNDVVIASSTIDEPFPLGQVLSIEANAVIPANLRAGRYYFGAIVDPGNGVSELNEVNNILGSESSFDVATDTVTIDTTTLPVAYVSNSYEKTLVASGGNGAYVWELVGGTMPTGLTFVSGPIGQIRGTPAEVGSANLTFKVTSNNATEQKTLTLDVQTLNGPLTIVTRELLPGVVSQPYPPLEEDQAPADAQRIVAVGGEGVMSFHLEGGAPAGMTLDEDGYLHGVPESRGNFMVVVSATDGTTTVTRTLPLTIIEPGRLSLIVGAVPNATLGEPYSYTFFTVGQTAGTQLLYDFVADSGVTPPGLAIGHTDGVLSGIPMLAGTFRFSVQVIEGTMVDPPRDTASVTLVVEAPADSLSITPTTVPDATIGENYIVTFEARQGVGPFVWTVENAATLPAGLQLEGVEVDGVQKLRLAGKPTALPDEASLGTNTGGIISFLVKLDDAQGRHAEQSIALRVIEAPAMTGGNTNTDTNGCGCNTSGSGPRSGWIVSLLLLGMTWVVRRQRRR